MTKEEQIEGLKYELSWKWNSYNESQEVMYNQAVAIHKLEEKIEELEDGQL